MGRPAVPAIRNNAELILQLAAEGCNCGEISRKIGAHPNNIYMWLKRRNAKMCTTIGPPRGEANPAWNGGKTIDKSGYILLYAPDHPHANVAGYVREHRLVMEQKIGRLLLQGEVVHHRDGKKDNNHPDNLELYESNAKHLADDLKGRCPDWTPDGKKKIRQGIEKSIQTRAAKRSKIKAESLA